MNTLIHRMNKILSLSVIKESESFNMIRKTIAENEKTHNALITRVNLLETSLNVMFLKDSSVSIQEYAGARYTCKYCGGIESKTGIVVDNMYHMQLQHTTDCIVLSIRKLLSEKVIIK